MLFHDFCDYVQTFWGDSLLAVYIKTNKLTGFMKKSTISMLRILQKVGGLQ